MKLCAVMAGLLLCALPACAATLRDAIRADDVAQVKVLIASGVAVNETDDLGATILHDACWLGNEAIVEVTGLRSPCVLIDRFQAGLKNALLGRDGEGRVLRKSGVMAIVIAGGEVRAGDALVVETPAGDPKPLEPV